MNDYCGLSSSARATAKLRRQTEKRREGYVWDVHQVRASSRRYSVDSNRHDVRSSSQHQVTRAHVARDYTRFDGPAGLPTSHAFVSAGFGCDEKTRRRGEGKRVDVDALARETERENESHRPCETCPSRLNVVNTKVQLRHLIIGHIIFIHERRTAAGNHAGGSGGPRGCAPVSHQSGRTREASTARIEEVRVKQPSIGGLLHVIEGAQRGWGGFEVRDEGVILVRGRRGV